MFELDGVTLVEVEASLCFLGLEFNAVVDGFVSVLVIGERDSVVSIS